LPVATADAKEFTYTFEGLEPLFLLPGFVLLTVGPVGSYPVLYSGVYLPFYKAVLVPTL
jgi:hypothetical protein